jgi:hypothetical protein
MNMGLFIFEVRTIWKELNIPYTLVMKVLLLGQL